MALEFNTEPYYDDYEDSKQFYRILFKPGRAVQARELTQIQTILQKQISRFGAHVFKEGSLVSGAEHTLDDSAFYVKVKSTFGGNVVNFSNIEGKYILEKTGYGRICYVKKYTPATDTDDITLHVTIVRGPQLPLDDDTEFDVITAIDSTTALFTFETITSACSGSSLLFHINEGVFFAKETFLFCNSQTVVVGKYTKSPSAIVGLDIIESIVEADEDDTLLDPAVGSSNYLAPGADRYKISLNLVTKDYTSVGEAYDNFIEIIKVRNGELQADNRIPIYSYLGDTLARRTYDESGDYIVKNFIPNILDNPSDNTKLILEITPGKAYVKGYEIETISPTHININKSRSTESIAEYDINTYYGNYTYVNTITGRLPTINTGYEVEIHNSTSPSLGSKIGTAQVRSLDYYSGTGTSTIFTIFLFDVNLSGGSFQTALSIVKPNGTDYTNPLFKALIDSAARTTALTGELVTQLFETSLDKAYFLIPQTHIKDLEDVEYTYKQHFYGNNVSSSTVTLTARTGDTFISTGTSTSAFLRNYAIVNVTTGERIPVDTKLAYANTSTNQVQLVFNTAEYDGDNIEVIATVRTPNENLRTKVLNQNYVKEITITDTNPVSLLKSDVYTLNNVFEIPSGNVYAGVWSSGTTYEIGNVVLRSNVAYYALQDSNTGNDPVTEDEYWTAIADSKSYYTLDNGQKDNYYDHGTISRVSIPDTSGNVLALISYFTHDGAADTTGYLSAESYPIDYTEIPTFISSITGERISLRDYVDFRPRRADDTTDFVFESYRIPTGFTNVNATIEYYLQRIDKVVLSREGKFKVLEGVPSLINPKAPSNQEDAITLYILELSAYTDTRENVKLTVLPYRRYTMKDIAGIDDRLSRMEFYTALSLLEEEVASKTLINDDGAILFKNGYLVDSFKGHKVGDVNSVEYSCSIDYTNGTLRAPYVMNSYPIVNTTGIAFPNNTSNLNLQLTSEGIVTVPYQVETFVNQPIASKSVSVNPFDVVAFTGTIHLRPSSDTWFDTETIPQVVVNVDGENDNYQNFTSVSTQYNGWETIWSGEQVVERRTAQEGNFIVTRETIEVTQQQARTGIETLKAPPSVVKSSTTNVVSESVIPYARAKTIQFEVTGMAPFSELYLYINGRNCSSFMATIDQFVENDSGNSNVMGTAPVITDNAGRAKGYIFFPNNDDIRFLSGEQNLVICDNTADYRYSTSFAQTTFFSQGLLQTKQTTVISTRGDYLVTRNINENRTNKFTRSQVVSSVEIPPPPDPPVIVDTTPEASYSLQSSSPTIREGETLIFTLTAENAPTNRRYQANLSGSINASDIGRALGNVTLTTSGSESINKAYLSVPVTYDAVIEGTEFIELEVDIPVDPSRPKLGGPLKLRSNVQVLDANIQTFTFTATPAIQQGGNVIVDIAAANLVSNTTVYYFANTTIGDDFTGNAATGSFILTKPTSNHTLEFNPNGIGIFNAIENFYVYFNYRTAVTPTVNNYDSFTQTRVLGNVAAVYNLSKTKPAVTEGESLAIVLETKNVASTTTVPYTITGVSTADINGASLTGNFTVGSNGRAYLDVVTTDDGSAEGTEILTLTLGLSSPNNLSIDVPIYDTGAADPIYDVRALGNTIINEGGALTFEISTRNVSEGTQIPYAILGTQSYVIPNTTSRIQTLGVTVEDITPSDTVRNNSTNYRVAAVGANGNAYVTITSVEDQILDGIKGGSFVIFPPDGKFVKFIILDTSNTRSWSGITVVHKDEIREGERLQYEIRLANTSITYPVTIPWSITPNRDKNPVSNRDFLPWIEKAAGTSGDVQIKNEADWYGYVGFYQDVLDIYTDFREGTTRYAQGNPGTIWANGLAQYNDFINNSVWRQKAALGQIEFGKWHFENYGRAQNRQVPVFSEVRGNVTITGSETGYINLTVKAEKSRNGSFYVNFNQQGSIDKNGTTLEGSPLKTVTTKINYNQDIKPTAIDKLSRKIVGTGDFLDSRLTYQQVCRIGGNYVVSTPGKTAKGLKDDPNFPGKICVNTNDIDQTELNTLAAYVLDRYRTRLNRNPTLNGFIAVLNRLLFTGYTPAPGSIYVSEQLYDMGGKAWVSPTGTTPYGVWESRERVWTVPEDGEYHIFFICDDGLTVDLYRNTSKTLERNILHRTVWTGGWWAYGGSFYTTAGTKKLVISMYNCPPCGGPGYGRFIIYKPSVKDWLLQYFSYDDSPPPPSTWNGYNDGGWG